VRVLDCSRVQNFSHLSLPWFHKVEGLEEVILPNYMDLAERELIQSKLGSGIQCH